MIARMGQRLIAVIAITVLAASTGYLARRVRALDARVTALSADLDLDKRGYLGFPLNADTDASAGAFKCPKDKSQIVLVPIGQSNAANYAPERSENRHGDKILNYYNGKCYIASDPLKGADGAGGSVWLELANKLVERGANRVIIGPVALGGTGMRRWRSGGDLHALFRRQLVDMRRAHLTVTHIPLVQGEADGGGGAYSLSAEQYFDGLHDLSLVASMYAQKHLTIAKTSTCSAPTANANAVRQAQDAFIGQGLAKSGPDLDAIRAADSGASCHLTAAGVRTFADSWLDALGR